MMDINEYQIRARETAIYYKSRTKNEWYVYPLLGLCGEVGELQQKFKKIIRDKEGVISEEDVKEIKAELGDCLWYISQMCTDMGYQLNEIARLNLEKLEARKGRGTIGGSGDQR